MSTIAKNIKTLQTELKKSKTVLVAVSKTKSNEDIMEAYSAGQRIFGENHVQELVAKSEALPKDIEWHQIGHLQSNKVKYLAPFISLIHSVDSLSLLQEIDKQAKKHNRNINCLLQVYIADEDTKYGLDFSEVIELLRSTEYANLKNIAIVGLMGIATNTPNTDNIKLEFMELQTLFDGIKQSFFAKDKNFSILSMGMTGDYAIAIEAGSNMVRIGSLIFGERQYSVSENEDDIILN